MLQLLQLAATVCPLTMKNSIKTEAKITGEGKRVTWRSGEAGERKL